MSAIIDAWSWPQWTWLVLAFLALVSHATMHGKPREPHNFPVALLAFGLSLFVLGCGGFFG